MMRMFFKCFLVWFIASMSAAQAVPQEQENDLVAVLMPLDQRIFEAAFLTCDEGALRLVNGKPDYKLARSIFDA